VFSCHCVGIALLLKDQNEGFKIYFNEGFKIYFTVRKQIFHWSEDTSLYRNPAFMLPSRIKTCFPVYWKNRGQF